MRTVSVSLVLFCAVISTAAVNAVEVKTFDSDLQDWTLVSGTGPGWINANLTAGNAAGEAGGEFDNGDTLADTTIGGTYTLNDAFSASGEFYVGEASGFTNYSIAAGFINTAALSYSTVGFHLANLNTSQVRFWASFASATSALEDREPNRGSNINGADPNIAELTAYQFEISYNPSIGNGQLVAKLKNSSGTQIGVDSEYNLSAGQRADGASLNAFGIESHVEGSLDFRIDNVTYSTITSVPEPNSLVLMLFGTVALWAVRRKR